MFLEVMGVLSKVFLPVPPGEVKNVEKGAIGRENGIMDDVSRSRRQADFVDVLQRSAIKPLYNVKIFYGKLVRNDVE